MMRLRRGQSILLGLTTENVVQLVGGTVFEIRGDEIGEPGLTLYLIYGKNHETLRAELIANSYTLGGDGAANDRGAGEGDGQ